MENSLAHRATKEWSIFAGEPVEVEHIASALYAFGSELACLRLHHKMQTGRVGYSENRKSWYYVKDVQFSP